MGGSNPKNVLGAIGFACSRQIAHTRKPCDRELSSFRPARKCHWRKPQPGSHGTWGFPSGWGWVWARRRVVYRRCPNVVPETPARRYPDWSMTRRPAMSLWSLREGSLIDPFTLAYRVGGVGAIASPGDFPADNNRFGRTLSRNNRVTTIATRFLRIIVTWTSWKTLDCKSSARLPSTSAFEKRRDHFPHPTGGDAAEQGARRRPRRSPFRSHRGTRLSLPAGLGSRRRVLGAVAGTVSSICIVFWTQH